MAFILPMCCYKPLIWKRSKDGLCGGLKILRCWFDTNRFHECSSILLADRDLVKSDAWFNSTVTKVNWVNGGLFNGL